MENGNKFDIANFSKRRNLPQPHEIEDIVKRYENDLENTETNYIDLI